ncbi:hypothetical protein B0H66DRAFT_629686 [Apodospora peruviana]|uniref:Uncharacterized protein n=1 Tax=Apodospora peruviana TaxID=516989 RepID=A0AAE0HVK6_9PEZI|nr:hypothetical protein B0H66DRAFT_629686 [Apodospora peruviana]
MSSKWPLPVDGIVNQPEERLRKISRQVQLVAPVNPNDRRYFRTGLTARNIFEWNWPADPAFNPSTISINNDSTRQMSRIEFNWSPEAHAFSPPTIHTFITDTSTSQRPSQYHEVQVQPRSTNSKSKVQSRSSTKRQSKRKAFEDTQLCVMSGNPYYECENADNLTEPCVVELEYDEESDAWVDWYEDSDGPHNTSYNRLRVTLSRLDQVDSSPLSTTDWPKDAASQRHNRLVT